MTKDGTSAGWADPWINPSNLETESISYWCIKANLLFCLILTLIFLLYMQNCHIHFEHK
jgi:hypothetical protein